MRAPSFSSLIGTLSTFGSLLGIVALTGCSGAECEVDGDCADANRPVCTTAISTCGPRPTLIGTQGALTAPTKTLVHQEASSRLPSGFDFNPKVAGEVWLTNYTDSSVTILNGVDTGAVATKTLRDPARAHFMNKPTGIAFNEAGNWATCGENDNGGNNFMGPALFTSDLTIFAKENPEAGLGLGSHLDMLHASPFCMGVAHVAENKFWAFDGHNSAIVLYDFHEDHGPGFDDHSDGEIFVHGTGAVERVEEVPSHLAYDKGTQQLYIADTGHKQVLHLDTKSGTMGEELPTLEPTIPVRMDDTFIDTLVPPGTLDAPSGIVTKGGIVYVGDTSTGTIHAFDISGRQWSSLATGLPAKALGALQVGPDGKLYYLDRASAALYRVDLAAE